jgi:release factor glutamine methyltransferase
MLTVLEIVRKTSEFFAAKGIESPRLNAELLVGHALGLKRMQLYLAFERPVQEPELVRIREFVRRRTRREPVQHIIGETEFRGLRLKTDRRALIPRPETELLVEIVAARATTAPAAGEPARILDLGTGGGAIALALAAAFPSAAITAVDASEEALALAAENAASNGMAGRVTFVRSDWFEGLPHGETYDLIVANPPYLSEEETAQSAPEVREFEPAGALTAAEGGLAALRAIVAGSLSWLAPGGFLALETGTGHHAQLAEIARLSGFSRLESLQDLTRRDRYFIAWR